MEKILKYKYIIVISILLLVIVGLFLDKAGLRWQLIYEKSIPDVELINYLSFDSRNIASGSVTGFVVFDSIEKQPKDLRQYVIITAVNEFDSKGNQLFYLTDILKMNVLSPKYLDPVVLSIKNISGDVVTLADAENNYYLIDKETKEVSMFDATKEVTKLITSDSKFRDFMRNFLK